MKKLKEALDEGWLAYVGTRGTQIRLESEKVVAIGGEVRPATKEEITAEKAKRKAKRAEINRIIAFNERPEVIAARSIRDSIELDLENVIDKLTPVEWATILLKLRGCL